MGSEAQRTGRPCRRTSTRDPKPEFLVTLCWPGGLQQIVSPFGASVFKSVKRGEKLSCSLPHWAWSVSVSPAGMSRLP